MFSIHSMNPLPPLNPPYHPCPPDPPWRHGYCEQGPASLWSHPGVQHQVRVAAATGQGFHGNAVVAQVNPGVLGKSIGKRVGTVSRYQSTYDRRRQLGRLCDPTWRSCTKTSRWERDPQQTGPAEQEDSPDDSSGFLRNGCRGL